MDPGPEPIRVQLLTQEGCAFCEEARDILGRLSGELPLLVSATDLASAQGQQLAARGGVLFAPGIYIEGRPFSYGRPSERRLRREFTKRLTGG